MNGIILDTLSELKDRKMPVIYAVITAIGGLIFWMIGSMEVNISAQGMDPTEMYELLGNPVIRALNVFSYVLVFLTVMATAGTFPNMLVKGTADFYLSKPISRTRLYLGRLFGVWVVYGSLISVCIIIEIGIASIVTDAVSFDLIYLLLVNWLVFLIWLSITSLVGVISGSTGVGIMAAFGVWLAQNVFSYYESVKLLTDSELLQNLAAGLYYIFPKTGEISSLALDLAMSRPGEWMPLWSSLLSAAGLIWIALILFKRRDY